MEYGANALSDEAVAKIFEAKKRPSGNPLILLVDSIEMARSFIKQTNPIEEALMSEFWPGPFTIIFERKGALPDHVTGGLSTIGIRIPNHPIARALIHQVGGPIAAPSANISGTVSGTRIEDIKEAFQDTVVTMIDDGPSEIGMESTVVRVVDNAVHILRLGSITKEQIASLGFTVVVAGKETNVTGDKIENPGAKVAHYQIGTSCSYIPYPQNMVETVEKEVTLHPNKKITIVTYEEHQDRYQNLDVNILSLGSMYDLTLVAKRLFTVLREIQQTNTERCLFEGIEEIGLGATIMDRIKKVCGKFL